MAHTINRSQKAIFNENLRDLWNQYILIQEQVLKGKMRPISINPETISLADHKFMVEIDESGRDEVVDNIYYRYLHLDLSDIESDSILVDETIWEGLSESDISEIHEKLAMCYIEMEHTPSINAKVFYGGNANFPSELTLEEIQRIDAELKVGYICKGNIEDIVACIVTLDPDLESYYLYLFGENHYFKSIRKRKSETITQRVIEYRNHFIPEETLERYSQTIGLRLESYCLVFKIENRRARNIMQLVCDYYDPSEKAFIFKREFKEDDRFSEETLIEMQNNIRTFISEAHYYCSKDEVSFETIFRYKTSESKVCCHIFNIVQNTFTNKME